MLIRNLICCYYLLKGSTPETEQPSPGSVNSASTRTVQSLVTLAESHALATSEVVTWFKLSRRCLWPSIFSLRISLSFASWVVGTDLTLVATSVASHIADGGNNVAYFNPFPQILYSYLWKRNNYMIFKGLTLKSGCTLALFPGMEKGEEKEHLVTTIRHLSGDRVCM